MVDAETLIRAVGSLGVVLAIIYGLGVFLRRGGLAGMQKSGQVRLISRTPVGKNENLSVVDIDGEWLVLGVTSASIDVLRKLDPPREEEDEPKKAWSSRFLGKRTMSQVIIDGFRGTSSQQKRKAEQKKTYRGVGKPLDDEEDEKVAP